MRIVRSAGVALAFLAAGLAATLWNPDAFSTYILLWVCLYGLLAVSLRLVLLIGEVNLATAAFFGLGAYGAAVATTMWDLHTFVAIGVGVIVATAVSAAFGAVTLRTTGAYFLLISFAFTEVVRIGYTRVESLGGNSGIVGVLSDIAWLPTLIVILTVLIVLGLWLLEASRLGLIMRAVEGHNDLAECLGFPTLWVKTGVLAIGSAVAGLAGGLYAHLNTVIAPGDFGFMLSIFAIAWVIVGGRGHILGAVLGVAVLFLVGEELRVLGAYEHLVYGIALIGAMVVLPGGLWGVGSATALWLRRLRGHEETNQAHGPDISVPIAEKETIR